MIELLRRAPLLSGLDRAQLEQVAATAVSVHLDEGQWLFSQGDPSRRFYFRPPGIGFFQPCNQLNRRPNRRLLDNFPVPKEYDYWTMVLAVD